MTVVKLNVGSGSKHLDGFINLDLPEFDIREPWPYHADYADLILMSHVLEHVTREQAVSALREAWRVLKIGGYIHIATPDMDKFIDCRVSGDYAPLEGYRWTDFNWFLGGNPEEDTLGRDNDWHKYMWCYGSLHYTLEYLCGFQDVQRVRPNDHDNPQYHPISLYVEARK